MSRAFQLHMNSQLKVVWALDPEEMNPNITRAVAQVFRTFLRKSLLRVEPVYLLKLSSTEVSTWAEQSATKSLKRGEKIQYYSDDMQMLLGIGQVEMGPHHVLVDMNPSASHPLELLIQKSESLRADFVTVGTHGRSGLNKILFGSFTERLIRESSVPVVVANPDVEFREKSNKVIFATDLNFQTELSLKRLIPLVRRLNLKLELIHINIGGALKTSMQKLDQISQLICSSGVECIAQEIDSGARTISEVILDECHNSDVSFVGLGTWGSQMNKEGFRSIAGEVIRSSPIPVWVFDSTIKQNQGFLSADEANSFSVARWA